MKRWNPRHKEYSESRKVDAFLADILAVCAKHELSIHTKTNMERSRSKGVSKDNIYWLWNAFDDTA